MSMPNACIVNVWGRLPVLISVIVTSRPTVDSKWTGTKPVSVTSIVIEPTMIRVLPPSGVAIGDAAGVAIGVAAGLAPPDRPRLGSRTTRRAGSG